MDFSGVTSSEIFNIKHNRGDTKATPFMPNRLNGFKG